MKGLIVIVSLALLTIQLGGCGEGQSAESADAQATIVAAVAKMSELQSYRESMVGVYSGLAAGKEPFTQTDELEVEAPEHYRTKTTTATSWWEFIKIGDEKYFRSDENPQWQVYPGEMVISSLKTALQPFKSIVNVEVLPYEEIGGVNCSHYRGRIDMDALVEARASEVGGMNPELEAMRQWKFGAELWIDRDSYIRQVKADVSTPDVDPNTGVEGWSGKVSTTRYFDFDEAIRIERPDIE